MTDKELRRMSRSELLEMLIAQMEENKALQERLELVEAQLQERQIAVEKAGTLAEAAFSLNGVFQAVEAAAQQYLENIQRMSSEQEAVCQNIQAKSEAEAEEIVQDALAYSEKMHSEADSYWQEVTDRAKNLLHEYDALRDLALSVERKMTK